MEKIIQWTAQEKLAINEIDLNDTEQIRLQLQILLMTILPTLEMI